MTNIKNCCERNKVYSLSKSNNRKKRVVKTIKIKMLKFNNKMALISNNKTN